MTTQLTSCLGLGCQGTKKETASVQEQCRLEMCAELRDRLTKPVQFTLSVCLGRQTERARGRWPCTTREPSEVRAR